MMTPLVRRSWAPLGQPAILRHRGARAKVSIAAALWMSPGTRRLGMYFDTLTNDYYDNEQVALFLKAVIFRLKGPIIAVWDGGSMHKGDPIREVQNRYESRLGIEQLPPYAPMLNPVEQVWTWLKYARLSNYGAYDVDELNCAVRRELETARQDRKRLLQFILASDVPPPRTLLF